MMPVLSKKRKLITANTLCKDFADLGNITLGAEPLEAYNRCWELSLAFSFYCAGRGIEARMIRLESPARRLQSPPEVLALVKADKRTYANMVELISHYVVWLPCQEQYVDWTARQFWPELDHPWIVRKPELLKFWLAIDP